MIECVLIGLSVYMIIAVFVYLWCAIGDYIDYKMTGDLDSQYPVNHWHTHLFAAFAASMWIVALCIKIHNYIRE